jgi:septum formation protein
MNPFLPVDIQSNLVLASASPRRREILEMLGFEFEIVPAELEEVHSGDPVRSVKLLAELKAVEIQSFRPRKTILAADTVVCCDGVSLGKPAGHDEAVEMLGSLSGRQHEVITGMALVSPPNLRVIESESTRVYFKEIGDSVIERYVSTGEPLDKAGAYGIQGLASAFVERIDGCYFNVVGLPVALLFRMFADLERMTEND